VLLRFYAGTTRGRVRVARARAARVAVSAYAGGAVGLAPRVAVARAGDGNAAGGDDGNAGRDRRDGRDAMSAHRRAGRRR
jgi:membrane fusion protein (multidrug efflux system)